MRRILMPHGNRRGILGRRSGGERPGQLRRWSPRRARRVARPPPIRRSPTTFGGSLVSRVGHGGPKPRRQLAGDRGGSRRNHAAGSGTSVQPSGQGTPIEGVEDGMGGKRTPGSPAIVLECVFHLVGTGRRSQRQDERGQGCHPGDCPFRRPGRCRCDGFSPMARHGALGAGQTCRYTEWSAVLL